MFDLLKNLITMNATIDSEGEIVKCRNLKIIAVMYAVVFVACIYLNLLLILAFRSNRNLLSRSPVGAFVKVLAYLNLLGSALTLPAAAISNFYCEWIFPQWTCYATGYIMYFVGCSCIYLMCVISYERFRVINTVTLILQDSQHNNSLTVLNSVKESETRVILSDQTRLNLGVSNNTFRNRYFTTARLCYSWMKRALLAKLSLWKSGGQIMICFLMSAFWSTVPFFGWSSYTKNGVETSCTPDWKSSEFSVVSYNVSVFVVVFLLPLLFMTVINLKMWWLIKLFTNNRPSTLITREPLRHRLNLEARVSRKIMVTIGLYCISWAPYGIICMYTALINPQGLGHNAEAFSTLLAKSSMVMTALTCILTDENLKGKSMKIHFIN